VEYQDNDLKLTIRQLEKVAENEEFKEFPKLIEAISEELNELKSRVQKDSPS